MTSTIPGYRSVVSNMSGLAGARGTVLGMSLDRMADSVNGQTVIDPKGYLTSLSSIKIASSAEIGDIKKARLLLKSVRDTNPKHAPGWIASARVEEAANNILAARKLIQEGCEACPYNEDIWIEAARLHPPEQAKTILASAVRRIPTSVKIFMQAADLETHDATKKIILRKGLESNPTSVTLWKATIELENAEDAKILLAIAVEKVPHSIEMWLALARLETYENAKKVLNQARRALPAEKAIWIAAAKLEESQNHSDMVDIIIGKAITTLQRHDAVVTRDQWIKEAELCEKSGAPRTSVAIVQQTIGLGVEVEDSQRTWADDASGALSRGSVETARAILAHSLTAFPTKSALWMQAVELEKKHGNASTLDKVLAAASDRIPQHEFFWLLRAKEQWQGGNTEKARDILTNAFVANPNSEKIWLAAVKLEWENNEVRTFIAYTSVTRIYGQTYEES
jgi:pre-mRNA-processing factor 6